MKFDLSQFKKIKEDDHTAIMQHPEGHHIVIAKSILSPKAMAELKKLPVHKDVGGYVEDPDGKPLEIEAIPEERQQPGRAYQIDAIPQGAAPNLKATSDDAGMEPGTSEPPPPPLQTPNGGASGEWNAPAATNTSGLQNFALPPAPPAQAAPAMPMQDVSGMQKAVNEQLGGIYGQAQGVAKQGKAQAKYAADTATALQNLQTQYQGSYGKLQTHVEDVMKDYAQGHINPNHYVESMDTGKKIRTAIGLILGGMGGGLTRQGNPAMDFLNKQIDRDIQAQQADMDKRKTLLGANMQQFGNLKDATDMTRVMQMGILASQFQEAGAASQGQIARGIAAQHAGALKAQMLPILQQMAWRNTLAQSGQSPPIESLPEDQRERAVQIPGGTMGMAPTKDDATKAKAALQSLTGLDRQLKDMEKFMATTGTTMPGSTKSAQANTMKSKMAVELKNLFELGALSGSDLELLHDMIPNPGQWMQDRGKAQLAEMRKLLRDKMTDVISTRLPGSKAPAQVQSNTKVMGGYNRAGRS